MHGVSHVLCTCAALIPPPSIVIWALFSPLCTLGCSPFPLPLSCQIHKHHLPHSCICQLLHHLLRCTGAELHHWEHRAHCTHCLLHALLGLLHYTVIDNKHRCFPPPQRTDKGWILSGSGRTWTRNRPKIVGLKNCPSESHPRLCGTDKLSSCNHHLSSPSQCFHPISTPAVSRLYSWIMLSSHLPTLLCASSSMNRHKSLPVARHSSLSSH